MARFADGLEANFRRQPSYLSPDPHLTELEEFGVGPGLIEPVGWVENSDEDDELASVVIDSGGLTIRNGKIALLDHAGSSVLTGGGFDGAWIPFIHAGVYNAGFTSGDFDIQAPVSEVSSGSNTANYEASLSAELPYWVVAANSRFGQSNDRLQIIQTIGNTSPSGRALYMGGNNGASKEVYQDIPVIAGQIYAVRALDDWGTSGSGELGLGYVYSWRNVDHEIIGTEISSSVLITGTPLGGTFEERTVVGGLQAPAGARYLRFGFATTHNGTGSGMTNYSAYYVAYVRLSQMQEAFNVLGIERRGLATDVFRIYYQGDLYGSYSIDENGKMQWGAGASSAPDVNLYRSSAGVLKTDTAMQVGGNLSVAQGGANEINISAAGNIVINNGYIELNEISAPANASANRAKLYLDDNAGTTRLRVLFGNGTRATLATS